MRKILIVAALLLLAALAWADEVDSNRGYLGVSIQATESFLREKIDHKFVAALAEVSQRVELWHSERELEIESLARSATLVRALSRGADARVAGGGAPVTSSKLHQRFGSPHSLCAASGAAGSG